MGRPPVAHTWRGGTGERGGQGRGKPSGKKKGAATKSRRPDSVTVPREVRVVDDQRITQRPEPDSRKMSGLTQDTAVLASVSSPTESLLPGET